MIEAASQVISQLFPKRCLVCDEFSCNENICRYCRPKYIAYSTTICPLCSSSTGMSEFTTSASGNCQICKCNPLPFNSLKYLWLYQMQARTLIRKCKYTNSFPLLAFCANELIKFLPTDYSQHLVSYIPSHHENTRLRLFEPGFYLANKVAKTLKSRVLVDLIRRSKVSKVQASLKPSDRLRNAKMSYSLNYTFPGESKILLVDDVITIGASAAAVSKLLYDAGAAKVDVLCLACSPAFSEFRGILFNYFKNDQNVSSQDSRRNISYHQGTERS